MQSVVEAPTLCARDAGGSAARRGAVCVRLSMISLSWILSIWRPSQLVGPRSGWRDVVEEFTESEGKVFKSMFPLVRACARRAPLRAAVVAEGATAVHLRDQVAATSVGPRHAATGKPGRPLRRPWPLAACGDVLARWTALLGPSRPPRFRAAIAMESREGPGACWKLTQRCWKHGALGSDVRCLQAGETPWCVFVEVVTSHRGLVDKRGIEWSVGPAILVSLRTVGRSSVWLHFETSSCRGSKPGTADFFAACAGVLAESAKTAHQFAKLFSATPLPQQSSYFNQGESQCISVEDRRKWCVAFEEMAKRMLGYQEDSEDLKSGYQLIKRTDGNAGRNRFFQHANSPTGKE